MKNLATHVPTSILRSGKKSELASKPERVQAAWTSIDKNVLGAVDDYFPIFIFEFMEKTFYEELTSQWQHMVGQYKFP